MSELLSMKNITKRYGNGVLANEDASFSLREGEIHAIAGENGAGKSTTMNIITGYISSTSGTVTVDGTEILENPRETKRKIGYLPEIPPLYPEMTVRKYLEFMFDLKKVNKVVLECQNACGTKIATDEVVSAFANADAV